MTEEAKNDLIDKASTFINQVLVKSNKSPNLNDYVGYSFMSVGKSSSTKEENQRPSFQVYGKLKSPNDKTIEISLWSIVNHFENQQ